MTEFQPVPNAKPLPGLVLRPGRKKEETYLRITHVFDDSAYVMSVREPEKARHATRPKRMSLRRLSDLASEPGASWGRLSLPPSFDNPALSSTDKAHIIEKWWEQIAPLIKLFEDEKNLARDKFSALIRERAEELQVSFSVLNRLLLRYYYFGGTRLALVPLPRGVKKGDRPYAPVDGFPKSPRRRGRPGTLASDFGRNDFIVGDDDIADMVDSLKDCLRQGPTYLTIAHEDYLSRYFKRRHAALYAEYVDGKRMEPVTLRQYRYYTRHADLATDLASNLRTKERRANNLGTLHSIGPGEVYEIDSTGGRIHLVSAGENHVLLGKPTIYLIIDRWSRFVVSAYISLRAPSYEEVRYALLVAFTSREERFRMLGVHVNDQRWPVGRMPAVICPDRGSDFMSASMEQAVVQDLRIDLTPLPPFCPDGKAIVERLIRELKRRMAASRLKGVYAERVLDPQTKKAAKKAAAVAVHTLSEVYRELVELIIDHNNRPHTALRRRSALVQAGIPPVPKDAYLWGIANISGLRSPSLTDKDYQRLLLGLSAASITKNGIRYKNRLYLPRNEVAIDVCEKATLRAKQISIRMDRSNPLTVFVPQRGSQWAEFRMSTGAESEIAGISLDEEEALSSQGLRLWAKSDHEGRLSRLTAKDRSNSSRKKVTKKPLETPNQKERHVLRANETSAVKRALLGNEERREKMERASSISVEADWVEREEQERLRKLEKIRRERRKR